MRLDQIGHTCPICRKTAIRQDNNVNFVGFTETTVEKHEWFCKHCYTYFTLGDQAMKIIHEDVNFKINNQKDGV
jgi:transposase-like protein